MHIGAAFSTLAVWCRIFLSHIFSIPFSISLSTAALRLSGGGSMFDRTGSHGSGAERRVPVMMRIGELSYTSMSDKHAHTGQQYSATE